MPTFSFGTPPYEAINWNDITTVLQELPDNNTKLVSPNDIRNSIYTVYESVSLKPTINTSGINYIGEEFSGTNGFYQKYLIGKKQYFSQDTLTYNLLTASCDVDIFIYNTKTDADPWQNTKIGFLAGRSQSIFYQGMSASFPFLQAKIVTTLEGNVIDFDIINTSFASSLSSKSGGNINILSEYGNILLNGVVFPSLTQSSPLHVQNGSVLIYQNIGGNPYMVWGPTNSTLDSISQSGTFSISANPILINGYDVMFSDSRPLPAQVGSLSINTTFSNVAVTEMIRRIIYPDIPPIVTLYTSPSYIEVIPALALGVAHLFYSITKVVGSSSINTLTSLPPFISSSSSSIISIINSIPYSDYTYSSDAVFPFPSYGTYGITLSTSDSQGYTVSATSSINVVYPIFYGTSLTASSTQSIVQSILSTFTKIINNDPNQTIPVSGNGVCFYYCVPNLYNIGGTISSFIDSNNPSLNQRSVFNGNGSSFTMSLNSPSGYWSGIVYNCYIYSPFGVPVVTTIGISPLYNGNFTFTF